MKKTTLFILAAGLASRYGGNKQIEGVGPHGEMLIQYSVYDAIAAGFNKIVLVIKPEHRERIEKLCPKREGIDVEFVYQTDDSLPSFFEKPKDRVKPYGTVHALICAKEAINEPFAVINADDFYGRDAYERMYRELQNLSSNGAAMVAYKLKNTLSANGGVTRGMCKVEGDRLIGVCETYSIRMAENGDIVDENGEKLDGEALVSMNMWGFSPKIFSLAESAFNEFLSALGKDELRAEYALPTMVDALISDGRISVKVEHTDSVWFGMTYKEDRAAVSAELSALHKEGVYPNRLF